MKALKALPLTRTWYESTHVFQGEAKHLTDRQDTCIGGRPSGASGSLPVAHVVARFLRSFKQPCEPLSHEKPEGIATVDIGPATVTLPHRNRIKLRRETQVVMGAARRTGGYPRCRPLLKLLSCTDPRSSCLFQKKTDCGRCIVIF